MWRCSDAGLGFIIAHSGYAAIRPPLGRGAASGNERARKRGVQKLIATAFEIKLVFSIPPHRPTPNFPPSWNVAPTDLPVKSPTCSLPIGEMTCWPVSLRVGNVKTNGSSLIEPIGSCCVTLLTRFG